MRDSSSKWLFTFAFGISVSSSYSNGNRTYSAAIPAKNRRIRISRMYAHKMAGARPFELQANDNDGAHLFEARLPLGAGQRLQIVHEQRSLQAGHRTGAHLFALVGGQARDSLQDRAPAQRPQCRALWQRATLLGPPPEYLRRSRVQRVHQIEQLNRNRFVALQQLVVVVVVAIVEHRVCGIRDIRGRCSIATIRL